MPAWLVIILAMPPVLWLAYCVVKAQLGLECGKVESVTLLLADAAAISWLALEGRHVMSPVLFMFSCLVLFTVNVGLSAGWLAGHLKRKSEKTGAPPSATQ